MCSHEQGETRFLSPYEGSCQLIRGRLASGYHGFLAFLRFSGMQVRMLDHLKDHLGEERRKMVAELPCVHAVVEEECSHCRRLLRKRPEDLACRISIIALRPVPVAVNIWDN